MGALTTDPDARKAFIDSLRQLTRFLASHPAAPVPKWGQTILLTTHGTDDEDHRAVDEFAAVTGSTITDEWDEHGRYLASRTFGVIRYEAIAHTEATMAAYRAGQSYSDCVQPDAPAPLNQPDEFGEAA